MAEHESPQAVTTDSLQRMWQPWIEFWMQLFEQRNDWMQMLLAGAPANVDPNALRKRWLESLGKSFDAYLRSPMFLDGMRRNMDAMTALKTTTELAKREVARQSGVPHVEDIAGLYDRLEAGQEALLKRLGNIDNRLAAIERKLGEDEP